MITGIGVDLCSISRIQKIIDRDGPEGPFFRKTFTAAEQKEAESRNDKAAFYAARFAAKEAVFKALSASGIKGLDLRTIETLHMADGRPFFRPSEEIQQLLSSAGVAVIHLSISTESDFAQAFVVAEGD